ncbi:MAG TPA: hypothetical protein ENK66_01250 [Arcobacter sp.]|jgi:uncharacterized protein YaaN involved in tellurite resistance|nr:hypothetical protein [Arcobacter sp.]
MTKAIVPVKPSDIVEIEEQELVSRRDAYFVEIQESDGGPMMEIHLNKIGAEAMKIANNTKTLMQTKVGDLLNNMEGKSPVANELVKLRTTMDDLNPHSLNNNFFFKVMPNPIKRFMLKNYVEKFQTNQDHVEAIFNGLREGKDQLLEKIIELDEQYKSLKIADKAVRNDIYLGEMLWEKLEGEQPSDEVGTKKLDNAKNKIARRIRDLEVAKQAIAQFFVSIQQTVKNNQLLSESIDSALFVGPMVLINALNIQAALAHQKKVSDALHTFQEGLGNMMEQNAAAIEEQTANIGDLYNNPVVGLEHLQKSYDKLASAVTKANEIMKESTVKARETSQELDNLTQKFDVLIEADEG